MNSNLFGIGMVLLKRFSFSSFNAEYAYKNLLTLQIMIKVPVFSSLIVIGTMIATKTQAVTKDMKIIIQLLILQFL